MVDVNLMTNREAARLILDSLGLDDRFVKSLSINGKEIINTENLSDRVEITVLKFTTSKREGLV